MAKKLDGPAVKQNTLDYKSSVVWALRELRPVSFDFKVADAKRLDSQRFGFVAQEVERILPNLVQGRGSDKKGLLYQDILAVLVLALRDQDVAITGQVREVTDMQRLVQSLLDEAETLEELLDVYENATRKRGRHKIYSETI